MERSGPPGREHTLGDLLAALARPGGFVLVGETGVGKSSLLEQTVAALDPRRFVVTNVITSSVPSVWTPAPSHLASTPPPAELTEALNAFRGECELVVVVDDVERADAATAQTLATLVEAGAIRLAAAARSAGGIDGELGDLLQRRRLARIDLAALDRDATAAIAESEAGRRLPPATHRRIWDLSAGNAAFVHVLAGSLDADDEVVVETPAVVDGVRSRLASVTDTELGVLRHLAFVGPCRAAEVAGLAASETFVRFEQAGIVRTFADDRGIVIGLAQPLVAATLRALTGPLERRSILGTGVARLVATASDDPADVLRLAQLAVDGDIDIDPDVLASAVSLAYHAGHHPLVEQAGQQLFERAGSFVVGWDVANAMLESGTTDSLRRFLPRWRALADRPAYEAAVAMVEGNLAFWVDGDDDAAAAATARGVAAFGGAAAGPAPSEADVPSITAGEVMAERCVQLAVSSRPNEALRLLATSRHWATAARIRGCYAEAMALRVLGRNAEAVVAADRGLAEIAATGQVAVALPARDLMAVRARARYEAGDLRGARADAVTVGDGATAVHHETLSAMLTALIDVAAGQPLSALQSIERIDWPPGSNRMRVSRRAFLSVRALCRMAGRQGAGARADLAELDHDTHLATNFDTYADAAREWMLATQDEPERVRQMLTETLAAIEVRARADADEARIGGDRGRVAALLYRLALGGAPEFTSVLLDVLADMDGPWPRAAGLAARGVAERSVDDLRAAVEAFVDMGMWFQASQLALSLGDLARHAGDHRGSTRWVARAAEYRGHCDSSVPPVPVSAGPSTLTRREREIAVLAADAKSSKEIAAELFISRRTVENHLARVYDKLGVHSRSELIDALA